MKNSQARELESCPEGEANYSVEVIKIFLEVSRARLRAPQKVLKLTLERPSQSRQRERITHSALQQRRRKMSQWNLRRKCKFVSSYGITAVEDLLVTVGESAFLEKGAKRVTLSDMYAQIEFFSIRDQ